MLECVRTPTACNAVSLAQRLPVPTRRYDPRLASFPSHRSNSLRNSRPRADWASMLLGRQVHSRNESLRMVLQRATRHDVNVQS